MSWSQQLSRNSDDFDAEVHSVFSDVLSLNVGQTDKANLMAKIYNLSKLYRSVREGTACVLSAVGQMGYDVPSLSTVDPDPDPFPAVGREHLAFCVNPVNPHEFYLQVRRDVGMADDINGFLTSAAAQIGSCANYFPEVHTRCLVQESLDAPWFRGYILNSVPNRPIEVLLVDIGRVIQTERKLSAFTSQGHTRCAARGLQVRLGWHQGPCP